MKYDYKWLSQESKKAYNDADHVMQVDIADVAARYHEHMSAWQTLPALPESDTWAVIICSEGFCDSSDMPMMAHYDLARDRFSVDGEEIPHGAIVKYFVLELS